LELKLDRFIVPLNVDLSLPYLGELLCGLSQGINLTIVHYFYSWRLIHPHHYIHISGSLSLEEAENIGFPILH
jgi:hypothetical protein